MLYILEFLEWFLHFLGRASYTSLARMVQITMNFSRSWRHENRHWNLKTCFQTNMVTCYTYYRFKVYICKSHFHTTCIEDKRPIREWNLSMFRLFWQVNDWSYVIYQFKSHLCNRFFFVLYQVPTINQETGIAGSEPTETLKKFRSDEVLRPTNKQRGNVSPNLMTASVYFILFYFISCLHEDCK